MNVLVCCIVVLMILTDKTNDGMTNTVIEHSSVGQSSPGEIFTYFWVWMCWQSVQVVTLLQTQKSKLLCYFIPYHPWKLFQPITGHADYCRDFSRNRDSVKRFLSWKSATKVKFPSAWNHCITKKIQRGRGGGGTKQQTFIIITKSPPKRLKECSLQSAVNSSVLAFMYARMKFLKSRDIFFKNSFFWSGIINM